MDEDELNMKEFTSRINEIESKVGYFFLEERDQNDKEIRLNFGNYEVRLYCDGFMDIVGVFTFGECVEEDDYFVKLKVMLSLAQCLLDEMEIQPVTEIEADEFDMGASWVDILMGYFKIQYDVDFIKKFDEVVELRRSLTDDKIDKLLEKSSKHWPHEYRNYLDFQS